ncbi:SBBP repeat-containing protein, partial [Planctomycetota bacterium]
MRRLRRKLAQVIGINLNSSTCPAPPLNLEKLEPRVLLNAAFIEPAGLEDSYGYDRTISFGGSYGDYSQDVAVDSAGGVFITGDFYGTVDFDPTDGIDAHSSFNGADVFITKLNADGTYGWTKIMGSGSLSSGRGIAVDAAGNILVTGGFFGAGDFDPSEGTDQHSSNGMDDIFVSKLYADGGYGWTVTFGGTASDECLDVAVDSAGGVFVLGNFQGSVDFNPTGPADIHVSNGAGDIFINRLNADGSYGWTITFGGGGNDVGRGLAVDSAGNVLATGFFEQTVDFDPTDGTDHHTSNGIRDIYVTKINADGGYGWTKTFGGIDRDKGESIAADSEGNIFVTGEFQDTVDFNPTAETDNHTSNGRADIFITRLNPNGGYNWTKTFGASEWDPGPRIAIDPAGNVLLTGYFKNSVDFDPSEGTDNHTSNGDEDVFVTYLSSKGHYGWTQTFGSSDSERSCGIAVDSMSRVFLTGWFKGSVDFDPTDETDSHSSMGYYDVFLTRLTYRILTVPAGYKTVKYVDLDDSAVKVKISKGTANMYFQGDKLDMAVKGKTVTVIGGRAALRQIDLQNSHRKTIITLGVKGGDDGEAVLGGLTGGSLGRLQGKKIDLIGDINLNGSLGALILDDIDPNVTISTKAASAKGFKLKADQLSQEITFSIAGTIKRFRVNGDLQDVIISSKNNIKKVRTKGSIIDSYILAGFDLSIGGMQGLGSGNVGSVRAKGSFIRSYISAGVLPPGPLFQAALPSVSLPYTE